ncbi:MAG: type II toxin-antitoxin system RelE/ParE family toxin [Cyanobacteria bacterium]|nr:type II toxin-antitoxin system RelE/ParE family toxin [Cyanobacteriota bacterium]
MNVQEYIREDGSNPYQTWLDGLNAMAAVKVTIARSRLELGNTSNVKWFDGIGEYRIDWGPGYRIYLVQDGQDLIMLFGGGTKKRQQADIDQALRLNQEYQQRKQKMHDEAAQLEPEQKTKNIKQSKKRS